MSWRFGHSPSWLTDILVNSFPTPTASISPVLRAPGTRTLWNFQIGRDHRGVSPQPTLDRNLLDAMHHGWSSQPLLLLCHVRGQFTTSRSSPSHGSVPTADRNAYPTLSPPYLPGLSLCPKLLTLPSGAAVQPLQASFQHAGRQTSSHSQWQEGVVSWFGILCLKLVLLVMG